MREKNTEGTQSANLEIPKDLILELLVRLPAKTLMRFQCVCKAWRALIRDPNFVESHRIHSQTRPDASYILFYYAGGYPSSPALLPTNQEAAFTDQLSTYSFHSTNSSSFSCNIVDGLICFLDVKIGRLRILNLTTGEKIALPKGQLPYDKYEVSYFLGFDSVSKNYKVLHLGKNYLALYLGDGLECEILTLGSRMWRKIEGPKSRLDLEKGKTVNGMIYWPRMRLSVHDPNTIHYFDVQEEKFHQLCPPKRGRSIKQLTNVGRDLALVCQTQYRAAFELWALDHCQQVWRSKQKITLPKKLMFTSYKVAGTTKSGELLVNLCDYDNNVGLVYYDLVTRKSRTSCIVIPGLSRTATRALVSECAFAVDSNLVENILPLRGLKNSAHGHHPR